MWDNLVDVATLLASAELSSLPANNLKNPLRTLVWRTADGRKRAECVFMDLLSALEVKAVAFINHNLTSSPNYLRLWGGEREFFSYDDDSDGSWQTSAIWLFYGDAKDYGSKGHDLTSRGSGSAYWLRTDKGACVALNGSGWFKRADADCGADFDFGSDSFTLEAWVKTSAIYGDLITKLISAPAMHGFDWYMHSNGKMRITLADGGGDFTVESDTAINDGEWHFIAVVVDRDNDLAHFYLDGNWDGQNRDISSVTGSITCDVDLIIGAFDDYGSDPWIGSIGAIKVTKGSTRLKSYLDANYGSPAKIETLSYHEDMVIKCLTTGNYQYWGLELSDINNDDNYLEMGRMFLGGYFEPSRQFARNWEEMLIDPSRVEMSEGGQEYVDLKQKYRMVRIEFPEGAPLSDTDRESYRTMLETVGCSKDIFIALDYDNQPNKWSLYGKFAQTEFNFREFLMGLYSTGFDFKESR